MSRQVVLLLVASVVLAPRPASATAGGEWLCEVLGFDAAAGRVYVHQLDGGGGDSFGYVAWLPIAGDDAGRLHGVDWNRAGEGTGRDPALTKRLAELRSRLVPLRGVTWPTLPFEQRVVATDSVPNDMGVSERLRVRAVFSAGLELEVACWGLPTVVRPAVYELPEGAGWLWLIAFIGDNSEMGYETQVPVLVRPGETGVREVEWRPAAD